MGRRYKHNLNGGKKFLRTLIKIIALNSTIFFVYYTFYLTHKQAYSDHYYPIQKQIPIPPPKPHKTVIIDDDDDDNMSCDENNNNINNNNDYLSSNSKYNVDLHNDPSKYLLLSSLFKTINNTQICKLFESKPWPHINGLSQSNIYCLIYNDGGYSYHFIDKILSNIFEIPYKIIDINDINNNQCLNIGSNDKLILFLRDPFEAISMHLCLYQLMKKDENLSILSNYWCDSNMFIPLNIRNEANKWNNMIQYVLNDYLINFGNENILMLQMENLLSESNNVYDEHQLLSVLEEYFKIANFLFDSDENKINNNKFSWITKIICQLDSNQKLLNSINQMAIDKDFHIDTEKLHCTIWNIVQNYATLYQYFPSTYNCI